MKSLTRKADSNYDKFLTAFCIFDDLAMILKNRIKTNSVGRKRILTLSETATICLIKSFYDIHSLKKTYQLLQDRFTTEFTLPRYKNFVQTMNNSTFPLTVFIQILLLMKNKSSGMIKIADSTAIPVCKNIRISSHKVMKRLATRYKTSTGYFYGLKLHIISDEKGNPCYLAFSTANVDDRKVLDEFLNQIENSLIIADAGYISPKLQEKARINNNLLLTCVRKNMKKVITPLHLFFLNLRVHIEHFFSVLKERYGLITSLPRSEKGYLAHYVRVIFGYLFVKSLIS